MESANRLAKCCCQFSSGIFVPMLRIHTPPATIAEIQSQQFPFARRYKITIMKMNKYNDGS